MRATRGRTAGRPSHGGRPCACFKLPSPSAATEPRHGSNRPATEVTEQRHRCRWPAADPPRRKDFVRDGPDPRRGRPSPQLFPLLWAPGRPTWPGGTTGFGAADAACCWRPPRPRSVFSESGRARPSPAGPLLTPPLLSHPSPRPGLSVAERFAPGPARYCTARHHDRLRRSGWESGISEARPAGDQIGPLTQRVRRSGQPRCRLDPTFHAGRESVKLTRMCLPRLGRPARRPTAGSESRFLPSHGRPDRGRLDPRVPRPGP